MISLNIYIYANIQVHFGWLPSKKNNGVFPCCLGSSGIGTKLTQPTQKTQPRFGWFGMIGGIMGPYFPYKVDPYQLQMELQPL